MIKPEEIHRLKDICKAAIGRSLVVEYIDVFHPAYVLELLETIERYHIALQDIQVLTVYSDVEDIAKEALK